MNSLEKMTFADWKLTWTALNPEVTIDDAYDLVVVSRTFGTRILLWKFALSRRTLGTSLLIVAKGF